MSRAIPSTASALQLRFFRSIATVTAATRAEMTFCIGSSIGLLAMISLHNIQLSGFFELGPFLRLPELA